MCIRYFFLLVTVCIGLALHGQTVDVQGKRYMCEMHALDGHGEFLTLRSDSVYIHSYGTITYGTTLDSGLYTVIDDQIQLSSFDKKARFHFDEAVLTIQVIDQEEFAKRNTFRGNRDYFVQRGVTNPNEIIVLFYKSNQNKRWFKLRKEKTIP